MISRRDSALLGAEGTLDQHEITASGTAAANVMLYVSESSGKVLRTAKDQMLLLKVTAEGRTRSFVQKLTGTIDLIR